MHRTANPRMPVRFRPGPPTPYRSAARVAGNIANSCVFETITFNWGLSSEVAPSDRRCGWPPNGRRSRGPDLMGPFDTQWALALTSIQAMHRERFLAELGQPANSLLLSSERSFTQKCHSRQRPLALSGCPQNSACWSKINGCLWHPLFHTVSSSHPGKRIQHMVWDEETIRLLRDLWAQGHSTAEIGRRLGVSKNAIVGKAHRLELDARPSPIKRGVVKSASERPLPCLRAAGPTLPPLPSANIQAFSRCARATRSTAFAPRRRH